MKKIISILCALAGITASVSAGTVMDQSLFGYSKFSDALQADVGSSKEQVTGSTGAGNLVWYEMLRTYGTGGAVFSGLTMTQNHSTGNRMMMTVTMMLDTSKMVLPTASGSIATIFSTGGATQWGLGVRSSGKLCWMWGGSAWGSDIDYTLPTNGSLILSMVTGRINGVSDSAEGARIYIGGTDVFFDASGLKSNTNANSLSIGANNAGSNALALAVQQLYVHNTSLSKAEIGALMAEMELVPEPATATLSLLGLACMALRRRRAA